MVVYSQIQGYIKQQYLDFKNQYGMKYVYTVGLLVGFTVLLTGGYLAHQYHVQQRETRAFVGFREVTNSYQEAQGIVKDLSDQEKINERWQDVEVLLDAVYSQNSHSYLAPYFLMYKAQIMLEKGESVELAREEVNKALRLIPFDTPLYNLFLLKQIKMGLDCSKQSDAYDDALMSLHVLAGAPQRYMHQEAVYLLGLYQINNGKIAEAQETWSALQSADKKATDYLFESPWAKAVKDKLK
jgi:hypothetical protein